MFLEVNQRAMTMTMMMGSASLPMKTANIYWIMYVTQCYYAHFTDD